jgi:dynein heavy chain
MTGVLQTHARKTNIPIDVLQFQFKILDIEKEQVTANLRPNDGVYIYGLFLEGAQWLAKKKTLGDLSPVILNVHYHRAS